MVGEDEIGIDLIGSGWPHKEAVGAALERRWIGFGSDAGSRQLSKS